MDLMSLTAVELGKKIQAKEVTVEEAVKAAIASIKAKEEKINSFVTIDEEGALKKAAEIQAKIDAGELKGALAALAFHSGLGNVEVCAHLVHDVVHGERLVVYLNRPAYHPVGQPHVYVAVVHHTVSHKRVDDPLQVAHAAIGRLGDKLYHVIGYAQPVTAYLAAQDVYTQLHIGLL